MSEARQQDAAFPETRWTLVLAARSQESLEGQRALAELCALYWSPLYFYVRRRGYPPEESEDLTQDFFRRLLEKSDFMVAEESRGKLRSFLLTSLKHFLADEWDKTQALKRGGGVSTISMDQVAAEERYRIEPQDDLSPDVLYDRQWAETIMSSIMDRLRDEHASAGSLHYFDTLHSHLGWNAGEATYAAPAKQLGVTENAVRLRVMRMRRRYGELLRACIAETVSSEEELVSEMNYLFQMARS